MQPSRFPCEATIAGKPVVTHNERDTYLKESRRPSGMTRVFSPDDDTTGMTTSMDANKPAVKQVCDDQTRLLIVAGEPGDNADYILQRH